MIDQIRLVSFSWCDNLSVTIIRNNLYTEAWWVNIWPITHFRCHYSVFFKWQWLEYICHVSLDEPSHVPRNLRIVLEKSTVSTELQGMAHNLLGLENSPSEIIFSSSYDSCLFLFDPIREQQSKMPDELFTYSQPQRMIYLLSHNFKSINR